MSGNVHVGFLSFVFFSSVALRGKILRIICVCSRIPNRGHQEGERETCPHHACRDVIQISNYEVLRCPRLFKGRVGRHSNNNKKSIIFFIICIFIFIIIIIIQSCNHAMIQPCNHAIIHAYIHTVLIMFIHA